jgi:hypothetical protein
MHYFHSLLSRRFVTAPCPNLKNALQSVKLHALLRVFAFALICFVVPASSVWAGEQIHAAQSKPERSTLLVRVTKTAKMIGYPAVYPGTDPADMHDDDICMSELYEARVRVLTHVGGPQTERDLTIRFTAHSFHVVWQKDIRFLLVVSPFEDKGAPGHFASYWDWENRRHQFCKDTDSLRRIDWAPIKRIYSFGKIRVIKKETDDWAEGAEIICITGREKGFALNG